MLRRPTSIRHTLLATIGGLAMLLSLLVVRGAWQAARSLSEVQTLSEASRVSDGLFSAAEQLSTERGIALSMLHAPTGETVANLRAKLDESRRQGDGFLGATLDAVKRSRLADLKALTSTIEARQLALRELRLAIDRDTASPVAMRNPQLSERWFDEVTALIEDTQALWMAFNRNTSGGGSVEVHYTRFKHVLGILDDYVGREQAVMGRLIVAKAALTPEEHIQLLRWQGKTDLSWQLAATLVRQGGMSSDLASYLQDAESHYATVSDIVRGVLDRPEARGYGAFPIDVQFWLELSAQSNDSLYELRQAALAASGDHLRLLESEARNEIIARATILGFAIALCATSFHVIRRRVLEPIQGMVDALLRATRGEFVPFQPTSAVEPDEIDKLARVLHAFQSNSEEIKRSSHALERHAIALERSNKELDDFAYIASHDLKEPLRGIHNHSRFLLEDNHAILDSDSVKRLTRLIHLSQRMEHLINDLLYFSRLGRQELAIQPTDLNEIVRDIEVTIEVFLEERNARIALPHALPTITCDRTRVAELLRNLITNGVKYNDSPEKIIEIGFASAHSSADGALAHDVFCVRDNGRGIPKQFYDDIFRIFKRLQASKAGEEAGTGVGLTFVKKIVERHGGRIWVESEIGKGSAFYFTLGGNCDDTSSSRAA